MHLLFLTHYFPPEVNAPASRTYDHAVRWVRSPGTEVTVVTNHPNHPNGVLYPGYRNRWLTCETIDGISVRRVKTFLAANAGVVRRTLNYLWFMVAAIAGSAGVRKPDLVAATSPQFFCAVAGLVVSRLKRTPFVFELRDLWPDSIVTVGAMRKGLWVRWLERLELFLYRKAALIVCVTDSFKSNLESRGIDPGKIVVVKNGVDLQLFDPRIDGSALRRRLGIDSKFVVSYIGTLGLAHGTGAVLDAARLLRDRPEVQFLIVGEGAAREELERRIREEQLGNVLLHPGVKKKEVLQFYAASDLNLVTLINQPLFKTVLPSKIFEVMGMAKPMLSTVDGECRRVLEEAGAALYSPPEDPVALAARIRECAGQRERLKGMGEKGRRYVEAHFDRDQLAARMLEALRRAALGPAGGS